MKVLYKVKGGLDQYEANSLQRKLAERLQISMDKVCIICDENFEFSDIIIIEDEGTIS